jgi:hypothetical protein
LQCFDRPRFFTGQLLTETELNNQQAYNIAKQKLHNRYLHGTGVVCGLEVTCDDCDSAYVKIHPGLALDNCGNDIVVCETESFNVIEAIAACKRVERKDCDPYRTGTPRNCDDLEQDWCITIRYREKMGQPRTALVSQPNDRCTCGKKRCACGKSNGTQTVSTTVRQAHTCEPSRIIEGYEIGVVRAPAATDPNEDNVHPAVQNILKLLEERGIPISLLDSSALPLDELTKCIETLIPFFEELRVITGLLNGESGFSNRFVEVERRFCLLLENLRQHLKANTLIYCDALADLSAIVCPGAPAQDDRFDTFVSQMQLAIEETILLLVNTLHNCICYVLLPKCPADPCDDRLLLACVTVREGRVVSICHAPRQYVLTPQNVVSAVASVLLSELCCNELELPHREQFVSARPEFLGGVHTASFIGASIESPMVAGLANVLRPLDIAQPRVSPPDVERTVRHEHAQPEPSTRIFHSGIIGRPVNTVRETLGSRQIEVERVNWSLLEAFYRNLVEPNFSIDEPVRVFIDEQDRVVGVQPLSKGEILRTELAQAHERIARLEAQVAQLLNQ